MFGLLRELPGIRATFERGRALFIAASFAFVECGGRSVERSMDRAETGGAGASAAGAPSGGAGAAGGLPSTGSGGMKPEIWYYVCLEWGDLENRPVPGAIGADACPLFSEIRYSQTFRDAFGNCGWEGVDEPVEEPPDTPPGDCCYGITWMYCR
jgi:hypothetical protein